MIRTITGSRHAANTIYTGAENGDIYRSTSLGSVFEKIDSNLPDSSIGGIAENPNTPNSLFVGLQRAGFPDVFYQCTDVTAETPVWISRSGSGAAALPQVPVNDVAFDPKGDFALIVGERGALFRWLPTR